MNTLQTARRVFGMVSREVKRLEKKREKARAIWRSAMHAAELKASKVNAIDNELNAASERLEDYEKEVKFLEAVKQGKRPKEPDAAEAFDRIRRVAAGEPRKATKKASKKVAKKASKKVAKKATKKVAKKTSKRR